ncbi:dihydrodipicolinate synthase family protein [Telmatocola sphagniphila]|uniref:Dihydrodipicolinate synthase family protein n=1 Tax=Telmatocola sphagniphila TaxID=1123043 RepID=A0A8E6B7H9_9BACT|nr:dihydrodipicolinate synthase family protein [Telmatocola sphagniphila]QVL33540.1 dihydrodipicolinate synthase family protein [Telmatocola sphagniphila]
MIGKLTGFIAATHTPFLANGELNLSVIEKQAAHLEATGVSGVFICGTTGECHSLTLQERMDLAERWSAVRRGTNLKLIVHVGANCLTESRQLAAHAQSLDVDAIAAISPSYFKPKSLQALIECSAEVAAASPALPFYFYDIPSMTGVNFPMSDYLEKAAVRIPNLAGVKFSNPDLMEYQKCLHLANSKFDMPWGTDEYILSALAVGAIGGVGSSYNLAAPIYRRLLSAFQRVDLKSAQAEQYRSVQIIDLMIQHGYLAASKFAMNQLGIDLGGVRLPLTNLEETQKRSLQLSLQTLGFYDWIAL